MPNKPHLKELIELAAPYWAAEDEVHKTYFNSPKRTKETDLLWLRRQCYKEFWGSGIGDKKGLFLGPVAYLSKVYKDIDQKVNRHEVLEAIDDLRDEFSHYCLFADIYDYLSGEKIRPQDLKGWKEDDKITKMRFDYKKKLGKVGHVVVRFSEGGFSSLYRVGMKLKGKGELNSRIAKACQEVYSEEIKHMGYGLKELSSMQLAKAQWEEFKKAAKALLMQRIYMRNEQFSFPLNPKRMKELEEGKAKPKEFKRSDLVQIYKTIK